jgi:hypothetical protein
MLLYVCEDAGTIRYVSNIQLLFCYGQGINLIWFYGIDTCIHYAPTELLQLC